MPKVAEKRKHLNNTFYFNAEENDDQNKNIELGKTPESNQVTNKRFKNYTITKQSDTTCNARLTQKLPSLDMLENMCKNDNCDSILFCENSFVNDGLQLGDEKPKFLSSMEGPAKEIKPSKSPLNGTGNLDSMEINDCTLNVEKTSTRKNSNNLRNIQQSMRKPLPSFIDLEQMFQNNDASDKLCNSMIKNRVERSTMLKVKEKDKITKSKQLLVKKRKTVEKRQVNKTPRLVSSTVQKPMPSFADLEQMFDENINDNFKSFHINDQNHIFENSKSLRTLANDAVKLGSSPETYKGFARTEPFHIADNSKNLCLTSSKYLSHLGEQLCLRDSEDNDLEFQSEGSSNIHNTSEIYLDDTNNCKEDCRHRVERAKYSMLKDDLVVLFDEKENTNERSEITNNLNVDAQSDISSESSKTVLYDYAAVSPTSSRLRAFSPIPSTSSDNETFLKNDIRFNESLVQNDIHDDVEISEIPCETIILDDDADNDITCTQIMQPHVNVDGFPASNNDDTSNNYYDTINVDESFDNDCEIVDVDVVINENNAILERYRKSEINKNNNPISLDCSAENTETETTNDLRKNNDTNHTSCKDKIADVVRNFFTSQTQNSSSSLSGPSNVGDSSTTTFNYLLKFTQSLLTTFKRQNSSTEVLQTSNSHENNTDDSINTAGALDESTNRNNISDDSVIIVSSTYIPRGTGPVAFDSNRHFSNNHPRRRTKNPNKNGILKPKAVTNKHNAPPANKNNSLCTTDKVRNIGDCPICLDNLSNVAAIASTNCGHIFCMRCIQTALKSSGKRCPTCRKLLKGTGYHQLFL